MNQDDRKNVDNLLHLFGSYENTINALMTLKRALWEIVLTPDRAEKVKDSWALRYVEKEFLLEKCSPYTSQIREAFLSPLSKIKVEKKVMFVAFTEKVLFSLDLLRPFAIVRHVLGKVKSDHDLRYFAMRSLRNHYHFNLSSRVAQIFQLLTAAANRISVELPLKAADSRQRWDYRRQVLPYLEAAILEKCQEKDDTDEIINFFVECCREIGYISPDYYKSGYINFRTATFDAAYLISNIYGIPTSIKSFDDLFGGGGLLFFENAEKDKGASLGGRTLLIRGRFGTGKSLLSLQLAAEVARKNGIAWVMHLEQSAEECLYTLESINALPDDGSVLVATDSSAARRYLKNPTPGKGLLIILTSLKDSFDDFLTAIEENAEQMDSFPLRMLCVDPINSISRDGVDETKLRSKMLDSLREIEEGGTNIVLVAEENSDSADELNFEQNIADTVIRLSISKKHGYASRIFEIMKSRFQREQRGEHPFSISPRHGLIIYPSSSATYARISPRRSRDKHKLPALFGLESFDKILGKDAISTGDVIVFQGTKGAYKTHLGLLFLSIADWKEVNGKSLLVSARDDNSSSIERLLNQPFISRSYSSRSKGEFKNKKKGDVQICNLPNGNIYPGYIIQRIEDEFLETRLKGDWIDRVMVDNIAHWEMSSPFVREDRTFGDTLLEVLRRQRVTSLLVCGEMDSNEDSVVQRSIIDSADCVVKFENFEFRGTRRVMIKVLKTRGMNHRRETFELILNGNEILVKPSSSLMRIGRNGETISTKIRLFFHSKNTLQQNYNHRLVETLKSVLTEDIEIDTHDRIYTNTAKLLSSASVVDELQILQIDEYQLPNISQQRDLELFYKYSGSQWIDEWKTILPKEMKRVRDKAGNFFAIPHYVNVSVLAHRDDIDRNILTSWSDIAMACESWENEHPSFSDLFFDFPKYSIENYNCLFLEILLSLAPEVRNSKQLCPCCLLQGVQGIAAAKIMRRVCHRACLSDDLQNLSFKQVQEKEDIPQVSSTARVWRHWFTTLNQMMSTLSPAVRQGIRVCPLPENVSISGNWYYGVPVYSAAPDIGLEIIKLFTDRNAELDRLQAGVGLPTRVEFYEQLISGGTDSIFLSSGLQIEAGVIHDLVENAFRRSDIEGYLQSAPILARHLKKIIAIPNGSDEDIEKEIARIFESLKMTIKFLYVCGNCFHDGKTV